MGSIYEEKIAAFLKQNGFVILERNYRCKQGEIDIIAKDGSYFVFIEVKYRASGSAGFSLEAIDHRKALRIRNAAVYYPTGVRRRHRAGLMRRGSMGMRSHISGMHFKVQAECTWDSQKSIMLLIVYPEQACVLSAWLRTAHIVE